MLDSNSINSNDNNDFNDSSLNNNINESSSNQHQQLSTTTSPISTSNLSNKLTENLVLNDDFNDQSSSANNSIQQQISSLYTRPIGSEREDLHVCPNP